MKHLVSSSASGAVLSIAFLWACTGPLPPENPKTQLDKPVPPIDVQVDSTKTEAPKAEAPPAPLEPEPPSFKDVGLKTPESVFYDATNDLYLVSNINGTPVDKDGNGFITQLNPDGTVKNLKFIEGGQNGVKLDAPKGLLIVGDTLYVADIQDVRKFDLATGAAKGSLHFPKATFLNDLAVNAKGTLFVTDSGRKLGKNGLEPNGTDSVYKVEGEKIKVLVKGPQLLGPNGIAVDADGLLVSQLGGKGLTRFDETGKVLGQMDLPTGGLDGVVALSDGSWLVASWEGQTVYRGNFTAAFGTLASDVQSPADIGYDSKRSRVLIPLFLKDEVRTIAVPVSPAPAAPATVAPATPVPATVAAPVAPTAAPVASAAAKPTPAPAVVPPTAVPPAAVAPAAATPAAAAAAPAAKKPSKKSP